MKANDRLEADVRAELAWDPSIKNPSDIVVRADNGTVMLRGTVGSLHQRRYAADAAKRVGAIDVDNELEVRIMDSWGRADADLRAAALQALQ